MKYEISDEDVEVFRRACWVAYTVLSEEAAGGVVTAPMAAVRDACNRLEAQRGKTEEAQQESAAADVLEGQSLLVLGD